MKNESTLVLSRFRIPRERLRELKSNLERYAHVYLRNNS